MATSTNPNATRGRASGITDSLAFPLGESLPAGTRLKFQTYSRFNPADSARQITTTIISLPLPTSIPDSSEIQTGGYDLGRLGAMDLNALNQAIDLRSTEPLERAWEAGKSLAVDSIRRMEDSFKVSALKGLALNPFISDEKRAPFGLLGGVIQNPHTNLTFQGINLKRHSWSWRFSPRSQQESDALQNIINTIKLRIHPEESFARFALDYPDTVEVEWVGPPKNYLPVINKAMVTNFEVSGGTGDQIPMYKSGAPIVLDFRISIQEINIITRNKLREQNGTATEVIT